ncbi:uncharacterized protein CDAR_99751 [Caerostris darwini]|uniref:Uncharacterized protein n=1 Tax=Caerostris darwini TaxID=1538125 RepID=A0AAV4SM83_9ARAC|nr:uncharacterized protein CDAR_99751 [Caerostris darwini]
MSCLSFINRRSARKYLPKILIYVKAVDLQIKPCYLWDLFHATVSEVSAYLEELYLQRLTKSHLSAFCINETIYVTDLKYLEHYLDHFHFEDVDVVDVSGSNSSPVLLPTERKLEVLDPVLKVVQDLATRCFLGDDTTSIDLSINQSTLAGFLVGYPVLYWYRSQSAYDAFNCLSMVPLNVYKVCNNQCELFSFSFPQELAVQIQHLLNDWFLEIKSRCDAIESYSVELVQDTISLESICM